MTIIELAKQLNEQLTTSTRDDGGKYTHLKDGHPQWMQDAIHKAHGDRLPDDDVYERISTIVSNLAELDNDANEDDIQDTISQLEPDIYTNDLTGWLHARNDNIWYLDEALKEGITKDGFQLLAYAQSIYIREIADGLISALTEYAENESITL